MTVAQGVHGRKRTGPGETFWQYRPYNASDSARDVDWRRSARSDGLFVRDAEWEASQSIWIWRDASPSMRFASHRKLATKSGRADLLTIALAALLLRGGERVGLLGHEQPAGIRPRRSGAFLEPSAVGTGRRRKPARRGHPAAHAQMVLIGDMLTDPDHLQRRIAPMPTATSPA